jgi:hypothetical protein
MYNELQLYARYIIYPFSMEKNDRFNITRLCCLQRKICFHIFLQLNFERVRCHQFQTTLKTCASTYKRIIMLTSVNLFISFNSYAYFKTSKSKKAFYTQMN